MKIAWILLIFNVTIANASTVFVPENSCVADVNSKRYIQRSHTKSPYPHHIEFICDYSCKVQNTLHKVEGTIQVSTYSEEDEIYTPVCQGVQIKSAPWGYEFDKAIPFYAYDTKMIDVKEWAFKNVSKNNLEEVKLLDKLKQDLTPIITSFESTGLEVYRDAASNLRKIQNDLPYNTENLDLAVDKIIQSKGQLGRETTAETLVARMLLNTAAFRIPDYLFKSGK